MTGATAAVALTLSQSEGVNAKGSQEVAQIAKQVTVRINPVGDTAGGSGVIIGKKGNIYTVLTANHVVVGSNPQLTILTAQNKSYPVAKVITLQKGANDSDLAVVTFSTPDPISVAIIGDSDQMQIGTNLFVAGYPAPGGAIQERTFEFTGGMVSSRPESRPQGYTLRYNALTRSGMSGGPVFDEEGRVVGIHGQGDVAGSAQGESGNIAIKTGFNAAIPIKTFMAKGAASGLTSADFKVDKATLSTPKVSIENPKDFTSFYARGLSRFEQGDKQAALKDLDQAISLNPKNGAAYRNRAIARIELIGDDSISLASAANQDGLRAAIQDLNEAIRLNPNDAIAYGYRGRRSYLGENQEALQDATQAINLDPGEPTAHESRGFLRIFTKDYKGSIEDYNNAIRLAPKSALPYAGRAEARFRSKDVQGAIEDVTQAIRLMPQQPIPYVNRGAYRMQLGDEQGAIEDANKAIQLNPSFGTSYQIRGLARYKMGDKGGAAEDFQKAANLFLEQGNTDAYKKAIKMVNLMK